MNGLLATQGGVLLVLLICSAFFSSSETAFFSLNPIQIHRLKKTRPRRGERVQALLNAPTRLLSTILIGNTLVNVAASAIGFAMAERLFPGRGEMIAIPAMTLMLLVFGEMLPKRKAVSVAEKLAAFDAHLMPALIRVATPLRLLLEGVMRLFKTELHAPSRSLTEDEYLSALKLGEEKGVLDAEERTMVNGIVRLEDMQASDVMTPRVDLIGIDLDDPPESWVKTAMRVQFRCLPIYRGSLDFPEGFLDVPRFLLSANHDFEAARLAPLFVPETAPLNKLLAAFLKEHRHVAFVSDEYGGTAGLITLGDILEEIADDVEESVAFERLTIQRIGENLWIVDGRTSLEEINYELETHLEAEGADRISGWISAHLGRMPRTGEAVEGQGCRVTVHRTRKTTIATVFIEKLGPAALMPAGEP